MNGSFTPKRVLSDDSYDLIGLFISSLHEEEEDVNSKNYKNSIPLSNRLTNLNKNKKEIPLKFIFIDQLELPSSNCFKSPIYTNSWTF